MLTCMAICKCTLCVRPNENATFCACVRSTWKEVPDPALPSMSNAVLCMSILARASAQMLLPGKLALISNAAAHVVESTVGSNTKFAWKYVLCEWVGTLSANVMIPSCSQQSAPGQMAPHIRASINGDHVHFYTHSPWQTCTLFCTSGFSACRSGRMRVSRCAPFTLWPVVFHES